MDQPTPTTPPPAYAPPAPVARPGVVTGAGITLIVLGVITGLVGILLLLGAAIFAGAAGGVDTSELPGMGGVLGAFAGAIFVFVLIVVGWAVLQLVSGIYVLGGREWARITGIVVSIIGILLALTGLGGGTDGGAPILSIAFIAAQAFVLYALFTQRAWFAARPG